MLNFTITRKMCADSQFKRRYRKVAYRFIHRNRDINPIPLFREFHANASRLTYDRGGDTRCSLKGSASPVTATGYTKAGKTLKDKRSQTRERRNYGQIKAFPLQDSDSQIVLADRRRVPDRRIRNIEVDWVEEDLVISQINCRASV